MCDEQVIARLLDTNEKMQASNDRKFLALATIYLLTVVGFFAYLILGQPEMKIVASETFDSQISQNGK